MYIASFLLAATLLTFQELELNPPESVLQKHHGEKVQIRGFPYQTSEGNWVLAGESDLKSCCVGSDRNRSRQIILVEEEGSYTPHQVIEVIGMLDYRDGRWLLEDYQVHQSNYSLVWLAIVGGLIFGGGWWILYCSRHRT
jgi:hypothetical protein